jgi:hypothetical protein
LESTSFPIPVASVAPMPMIRDARPGYANQVNLIHDNKNGTIFFDKITSLKFFLNSNKKSFKFQCNNFSCEAVKKVSFRKKRKLLYFYA